MSTGVGLATCPAVSASGRRARLPDTDRSGWMRPAEGAEDSTAVLLDHRAEGPGRSESRTAVAEGEAQPAQPASTAR